MMPLRTRCRASCTARSAIPTTTNAGTPRSTCASTSVRRASTPEIQKLTALASIRPRYGSDPHRWVTDGHGSVAESPPA